VLVKTLLSSLVLGVFVFSGCSIKKVYEPKVVGDDWTHYSDAPATIVDVSSNVAALSDNKILLQGNLINLKLADKERVIGQNDGVIITTTIDGKLTLVDENNTTKREKFDLKKTVATANVNDTMLAVVFADNEIAVYDRKSKSLIFKEGGAKVIALNSKMAMPHFMQNLVIFATLDGKIVIVNTDLKKRLRTVIVSSKDMFNNIIFFDVIDDKIVTATDSAILSLGQKEKRAEYDMRDLFYDGKLLYVTTKQGEVIALNSNLEEQAKIKFPFAHFLAFIVDKDKIYLLEKEGYMIVLDKDMKNYTVHEVDIDDGYIFVDNKRFYVADEYIDIAK
jgi:hypothetical protein